MYRKTNYQKIMAVLLCLIMLLGNIVGVNAAEENSLTANVSVDVTDETVVPDDNQLPDETVVPDDNELPDESEVPDDTEEFYEVAFSYKDMYGQDGSYLFETSIADTRMMEGTEVLVSVNYKGEIGWNAVITGASGIVPNELTEEGIIFIMPGEDINIAIEEMEVYNQGDLSAEDTVLGEDVGKEHQVTTSREYEPDVSLGKSAKWDDIEKGLATLTLTQNTSSDWSNNPADYIIVLDRTVSMVVDYSIVYGENSDNMGFGCSVCLNPNHFYMYNGKAAKLIDYGHGFYISSGEYFSTDSYMGSEEAIWEHHYNSSGKRIAPRVYNGCTDRLKIAQNSIKKILDELESQNQNELAGGKKNRVMYWSFSGANELNDGTWDEVPEFTEDMKAVKQAMKYEGYPGTYYHKSFLQIQQKLKEKQSDKENKDIPTKVIFISDGVLYDKNPDVISALAKNIRETPNTKLYTILIGNSKDSEAGKRLKSYATSPSHFATVTSNWNVFVDTITAIQKDQFEIKATEKVVTDKINTEYWEVIGEPILESGNGTASLDAEKKTLTWNLPEASGKTYTCKLQLKLKDNYRYLMSDTYYPTNADEEGITEEQLFQEPTKAGGTVQYKISGGKYNGEKRIVGVLSPELKYGTVAFEGNKIWSVKGSNAELVELQLNRTMPGTQNAVEINNTTTNRTRDWKYVFRVRRLPDGTTYPLIKYNNAGEKITYEVSETAPVYYTKVDEKRTETEQTITTDFYNEPFKIKAQVTKIDEETKNPLSGAEFSVYVWSQKANAYIPYLGTNSAMTGAASVVKLEEGKQGVYITPVWLYYSPDNLGKFRIIETKAPKGYFGDWKNASVTDSDQDKRVYDLVISEDVSKNGETVIVSNVEEEKFTNQRVKGQLIFTKLDKEGQVPQAQGEASLAHAVYKLYAAEDIVHQDGSTGVLYKKDEEIKVSATANLNGINVYRYDVNGNSEIKTERAAMVRIDDLELGKYYIKEVKASEGYLVDPQKYEVDVAYIDEKTEISVVHKNVCERVMKQSLSFYKYTADQNSDVLEPMKGAKFSVYLVNDLENGKYSRLSDEELVQAVIDDLRNPVTLLYDTYKFYAPAAVFAESASLDVASGRLAKAVVYGKEKTYEVFGENEYLVVELEADEKGIVKVPALPYGRYIIIETTTPEGKTATRPFVMNVTCDEKDGIVDGDGNGTPLQDKQLTVLIDRPIMSLVRILKRDANSKKTVLKEGASYMIHDVEGAWYDYITNEMTTSQKKEYQKRYGDLVVQYSQGTYYGTKEQPFTTKLVADAAENQNVYIETPLQLPSGMYELEEIFAPEGYILQGHEGVIAKKKDAEGNKTYHETEEEGMWQENAQGRVRFIVSNNESVYDEEIRSFVTTIRQDNEPAIGKISIYVEGEQLTDAQKGKGSDDYNFEYELKPIEGAAFEIRAAEDIYSQESGVNAVRLFKEGELVTTLITDKNGQAWTGQEDWEGTDIAKGLPLGKYTVSQVIAGEGFYLSAENAKPVEVEIAYEGQEIPVIYRSSAYKNPRQMVRIEAEKLDADTKNPVAGAVFGLYTKTEMKNYFGKTIVATDTLIAVSETIMDGETVKNAVFGVDLPFGEYYVKELKAPDGYVTNPTHHPISITYAGQENAVASGVCKIQNEKTKNSFAKTDVISGVRLSGAQFEIWEILTDENGRLLKDDAGMYCLAQKAAAAWTSSAETDYIVEGLTAGKTYIFRERKAPSGYVGYEASDEEVKKANQDANILDEEVMFVVQDTADIVKHEMKNQRVVGNLNITKEGEFLTEVKISVVDHVKNLVSTVFQYLFGRVENVTFGIYVKEDIYTPDGSGQIAVWTNSEGKLIRLEANTLIDEVTTDYNGIAIVKNLPLGKYFVKEVSAGGKGNFLLSKEIQELELSYVDQNTPIVNALLVENSENMGIYYVNERQKVRIVADKYELGDDGEKLPVAGALFGLYSAEDIFGYMVTEDKTVRENITALIPADTLIETVESDKKGSVSFLSDLPCGKYYIKELNAAEGYLQSSEIFNIDASYTGESGEKVLAFYYELQNQKTEVFIRKTDLYTGEDIKGAELCVIEKSSGNKIEEWITDGRTKKLEGLKLSNTEEHIYILKEAAPAKGYVTAEDICFKLVQEKDETGNYLNAIKIFIYRNNGWEELNENVICMKDDVTKIEIRKVNGKTEKMISGAKLQLKDSQGKTVAAWTSAEKEGFCVERLPIGTYRIIELEKMPGYKEAKPLVVKVLDSAEKQVFIFENTPEPVLTEVPKSPQKPIIQQIAAVSTGDLAPITFCAAAVFSSLVGFGISRKRRK